MSPASCCLRPTDKFEKVEIRMDRPATRASRSSRTLELQFKNIVVTYSKRLGVDNIPMPPFVYGSPAE